MDLVFNTEIDGYFKYKIYRNTPDNIIYESPIAKNLILNSGLSHLFTKSVEESIKVVDFGISNTPPNESQTGIVGGSYFNSVLFTDLSALNCYSEVDYENSKTTFRSFFRTPTSLRPLQLREFAIKPDAFEDAFSRQLITIDLSGGDGIEFYYDVEVKWPCGMTVQTMPIEYRVGNEFNELNSTVATFPSNWTSLSGYSDIQWTSIIGRDDTLISVASADTSLLDYKNNIAYSTNDGIDWNPVTYTTTDTISSNKFNDIAYGFDESLNTNRYVAVGPNDVAFSNYSVDKWDVVDPYQVNNWTSITFGSILTFPYTGTFVAVSDNGSIRAMKSTTGQYWTSGGDTNVINDPRWSSITYGPIGGFVAVALSGNTHQIAYSKDAATWTAANSPETNNWRDVAYGNGRYIAISNDGNSRIMYAEESNLSVWLSAATPYQNEWTAIEYGNGLFVAIASGGTDNAMFSRDGEDWFNVSNIDSKSWIDLTYTGDKTRFFTAIATNESDKEVIGRASYKPASYPVGNISLSSSLVQIPVSGHVFNQDNVLYTLSGIDLRTKCLSTPYLEHINYSTGFESSSFAESVTTQIFPNSACSTYTFGHLSGYGPIKGGLITTGRIQDRTFTITDTDGATFTDILSGTTNGVYAFQWEVPKVLQGTIAATGPIYSPYFVTPEAGSLVKPLLQPGQNPNDLKLEINVCHTWGPSRQLDITTPTTGATAPTPNGIINFKIPISNLNGGEFLPVSISSDYQRYYPQSGDIITNFPTTYKILSGGDLIVENIYITQEPVDQYVANMDYYPLEERRAKISYDNFIYSTGFFSEFIGIGNYQILEVPELIVVFYDDNNIEITRSTVQLFSDAYDFVNGDAEDVLYLLSYESSVSEYRIPSWKSFVDLAKSYPPLNNTPALTSIDDSTFPEDFLFNDEPGLFNKSRDKSILDNNKLSNELNTPLKNYYGIDTDIVTNVNVDFNEQAIYLNIDNSSLGARKISKAGLLIKDYFTYSEEDEVSSTVVNRVSFNTFVVLWDFSL